MIFYFFLPVLRSPITSLLFTWSQHLKRKDLLWNRFRTVLIPAKGPFLTTNRQGLCQADNGPCVTLQAVTRQRGWAIGWTWLNHPVLVASRNCRLFKLERYVWILKKWCVTWPRFVGMYFTVRAFPEVMKFHALMREGLTLENNWCFYVLLVL